MRGLIKTASATGLFVAATAGAFAADAGDRMAPDVPAALVAIHAGSGKLLRVAQTGLPSRESAAFIAGWVSRETGMAQARQIPDIALVPAQRLVALRLRGVASDRIGVAAPQAADIVAVYDDEARTIYLPDGWRGATAADWSTVVHEMVHHLQNEAGQRFDCPELREKAAFSAQQRWLAQFGTSLASEFGLDEFTVLARTNCLF